MKANRINILSEAVANQIAAGEVVKRPANIVKELVENSIDAGATQVDVYIEGAGKNCIIVSDNGCGMNSSDALIAFERHATSKISSFKDLYALATNGFRGEALPSISSIASVTLKTCEEGNTIGTCVTFKEGRFESQEPCACKKGTTVQVYNIFSNIPVRRRFLKSDIIERKHIIETFLRIALVYPEVAFSLRNETGFLYNLEPSTSGQRIVKVFGERLGKNLIPVQFKSSLCNIEGYVGRPESASAKIADKQMFFVNGRFMRHSYFHNAVMKALNRLLPAGMQVPYFIYFDVNPEDIDVNVHPTKTEIKFDNEQAIYEMLIGALHEAVGGIPQVTDICTLPDNSKEKITKTTDNTTKTTNRDKPTQKITPATDFTIPVSSSNWTIPVSDTKEQEENMFEMHDEALTVCSDAYIQFNAKYIIVNTNKGLMFINQENAHERILFDEYHPKFVNASKVQQQSLFEEFAIENKEDNDARVFDLAVARARREGVAVGQPLSCDEMKSIVNRLLKCENINYSPTRKRIFHLITGENINQFINIAI